MEPWQADVEKCESLVAECHKSSERLASACSPTAFIKVTKQLGELDLALDSIRLNVSNSAVDQQLDTYHVDNYNNLLQVWISIEFQQLRTLID